MKKENPSQSSLKKAPPKPTPTDAPSRTEIQVSLFGPGFGESIVVHVGAGKWFIIDSCVRPGTNDPAPLAYLQALGVDTAKNVDLIIASHWHDDHTRGISKIVEACPNAHFSCSAAIGDEKLIVLGARYEGREIQGRSGINEVIRIQKMLFNKKQPPRYASAGSNLHAWPKTVSGLPSDVALHAMSPVDLAVQRQIEQLAALLRDIPAGCSVPRPKENLTAIVLRLDIGNESILLGSDMESSASYGWTVILADPRHTQRKSFLFKVAHHGAESGHDPGIWKTLLDQNPIAIVTPFVHGNQEIPSRKDLTRIRGLTKNGYITRDPTLKTPGRKRSPAVQRTLMEKGIRIWSDKPGHIRFRFTPGNPGTQRVEVFDGAYPL